MAGIAAVTANGYIYVSGNSSNTVYYAKANADGTIGSWITDTNVLPGITSYNSSVVANGYVYVIGGASSAVYYAKLNANGSTGVWQTNTNALATPLFQQTSVVANGYVYVLGGWASTNATSATYYAKLNADGSTGTWTSTTSLPAGRNSHVSVVANGYVYVIGGYTSGGYQSTVYYSKINSDGTLGAWATNANALPSARGEDPGGAVYNGYVYIVGGYSGSGSQSTVYYASTSRIQMGGSLDLVGVNDGNLSDPGESSSGSTGGSLTAGNTQIVGSLSVQGQSNFAQGMSVLGNFTNTGSALFQNGANSTTAFQVQNATGTSLFTIDTTNAAITIAADLTVNGHFISGNKSGSTTVATGAATNCSGGSPSVTISGNDTSGTVTINTGTGSCSAGVLATVTFANAYGVAPKVILAPAETNATGLQYYNGASNTATFTIDTSIAPTAATTYKYNYWTVQ
jgi:hypothetical protein